MTDLIFVIAAMLGLTGCIVYLMDTLKGKVKPNKVSWFLWSLGPLIAFFAQLQQGVGAAALITFSAGFGPLLVFIGSFVNKQAEWKITKFDISCGVLSLLGLFLWFVTQTGNVAIFFSILADTLACLPTIAKAYKAPETENVLPYLMGLIGTILTLFAIKTWSFAYVGFPLYLFFANIVLVTFVQFKIRKHFRAAFAKKGETI